MQSAIAGDGMASGPDMRRRFLKSDDGKVNLLVPKVTLLNATVKTTEAGSSQHDVVSRCLR